MKVVDFKVLGEYNKLKSNDRYLMHLLLSFETPSLAEHEDHIPISVVIVIDKSKSMHGEKLESVIEASSALVNWLTRKDYVGIVAYDTHVEVIQPLISLTDKFSVIKKIQGITAGSSTNLSGGWLQGLRMLRDFPDRAIKRVILLTDGMANTGIIHPAELRKIAKEHRELGITTTTMGVGKDFSETLLKDIAMEGGGNFYFIETPEQSSEIFFKEFGNIASLYGQGFEIKVQFSEGISFKELLSEVPHELHHHELILRPGDIRSDDIKSYIIVTEVDGNAAYKQPVLIKAEASFYNLTKNSQFEKIFFDFQPEFESDIDLEAYTNPKVRLETLIASTSKIVMEASRLVAERDLNSAKELLNHMVKRLSDNENLEPNLIQKLIDRLNDMLKNIEENLAVASKKMLAQAYELSEAFYIRTQAKSSKKGIYEVFLQGQLDLYKCPELKNIIKNAIESGYRYFIIDMTDLNYIDSSGIGTLIQISNWLKNRQGLLVITNVQGNVEKIFEITKLNEFFIIKDSLTSGRIYIQELIDQENR